MLPDNSPQQKNLADCLTQTSSLTTITISLVLLAKFQLRWNYQMGDFLKNMKQQWRTVQKPIQKLLWPSGQGKYSAYREKTDVNLARAARQKILGHFWNKFLFKFETIFFYLLIPVLLLHHWLRTQPCMLKI